MKRSMLLVSVGALSFFGLACEEKIELKTCPKKGIGVETASGKGCSSVVPSAGSPDWLDCKEQVESYMNYDCTSPQICVDQGKYVVEPPYVINSAEGAKQLNFIITNCSTGNGKLKIKEIVIAGDTRAEAGCAFKEPELVAPAHASDKPVNVIDPQDTRALRVLYQPQKAGADHAAIHIYTDAQNFPKYVIPICGTAVDKPSASGSDGGTSGTDPSFDCQDVKDNFNTSCHKKPTSGT